MINVRCPDYYYYIYAGIVYDTTDVGYIVNATTTIRHLHKKCCILILFGCGIIVTVRVCNAATSCAVSSYALLKDTGVTYFTDE